MVTSRPGTLITIGGNICAWIAFVILKKILTIATRAFDEPIFIRTFLATALTKFAEEVVIIVV